MSIGSSSTPIQAQSPRVAAHLVQNATNAVNTTPAGQGNLASAVMSAQALSAPPAQTGESTSVARGPNVDGTAQPSNTAGSGSTNATAAAQAPAGVSPGQEPGTEKHGRRDEEHGSDLPTEAVLALTGDDQGKKRQADPDEEVEEAADEELKGLEVSGEANDDGSFADLLSQLEPSISTPNVRAIGTRFGRVRAARAYSDPIAETDT